MHTYTVATLSHAVASIEDVIVEPSLQISLSLVFFFQLSVIDADIHFHDRRESAIAGNGSVHQQVSLLKADSRCV